ncbi:MAG: hypothetical protein FWD17_09185 [Polyangiaceae bacterium]|nr:hypothetical protein [Polyangiaceae bacterium]
MGSWRVAPPSVSVLSRHRRGARTRDHRCQKGQSRARSRLPCRAAGRQRRLRIHPLDRRGRWIRRFQRKGLRRLAVALRIRLHELAPVGVERLQQGLGCERRRRRVEQWRPEFEQLRIVALEQHWIFEQLRIEQLRVVVFFEQLELQLVRQLRVVIVFEQLELFE